ncbi:hypothetical protein F5B22DRAFT_277829 [Xylaria bambusicola]|uniref:uncharacterized protein n=1 Tax=Xylaria bambusicola TaxID=326684 RepID=UPI002007DFFE|nr:uncharacterized protein F5B22DRAFT_277829 [Xylaria bambusicola]KAI0513189.1 hypothetical protein F5B22DRAFT_277829 [Xylaria bambusicola]
MDAWKGVLTSSQQPVYVGQWTNWSRGPIFGATLTVTQRDGNLIIAFAAFFVTIVASRAWRIICVSCHQVFSSNKPQDALYHQRQVILRNSSSPQSTLWSLVQLGWGPKGSSIRKVGKTTGLVSLALLCLASFTVVTYVLPYLSSSAGDEVLLQPGRCGFLDTSLITDATEYNVIVPPLIANLVTNAANYATQCYANSSGTLGCSGFIKDRIPTLAQFNATCPFQEGVCRGNASNLFLDTGYVNSHDHFGLNTPLKDRILFRKTLHCAPLVTKGYTTTFQSPSGNYTRYHHGFFIVGPERSNNSLSDGLYMIEDLEDQYKFRNALGGLYPIPTANYQIDSFGCRVENRSAIDGSEYVPSSKLRRPDGDAYIFYLSGNGVQFTEKSMDTWYRAIKPTAAIYSPASNSTHQPFIFDEAASPLSCVEQHQFCYEALPKGKQCGPLASLVDSFSAAFDMSPSDAALGNLVWVIDQTSGTSISEVINTLGAHALTSQRNLIAGNQGPIPANQWQQDVTHWWATSLAVQQSNFIENVVGPSDARLYPYVTPPQDSTVCSNQKIRNTAYTSFSVFGLYVLFLSGILLIIISYSIEPILSCFHRRGKYSQYKYLEWVTNESLQLHRLAHEGIGWGTWSRATEDVPITKQGQVLGCLDITEPLHPRLYTPTSSLEDDAYMEDISSLAPERPILTETAQNIQQLSEGNVESGIPSFTAQERGETRYSRRSNYSGTSISADVITPAYEPGRASRGERMSLHPSLNTTR